jgi:hypothetical protein
MTPRSFQTPQHTPTHWLAPLAGPRKTLPEFVPPMMAESAKASFDSPIGYSKSSLLVTGLSQFSMQPVGLASGREIGCHWNRNSRLSLKQSLT